MAEPLGRVSLSFQCQCGAVTGRLRAMSPARAVRFACCCDDCQACAHHLGRSDILDENGATDVCHVDSSRLEILTGIERLATVKVANLRLRSVLRWYCGSCKSPLFNTYDTSKRSFLGIILANTALGDRDRLLGPSTGLIWRKFAVGDASGRKDANIAAILIRLFGRQVSARMSGDYRNTPLFDRLTDRPIAMPYILSAAERAEAIRAMAQFRR